MRKVESVDTPFIKHEFFGKTGSLSLHEIRVSLIRLLCLVQKQLLCVLRHVTQDLYLVGLLLLRKKLVIESSVAQGFTFLV